MDSGKWFGKAEKAIWETEFHVSHINRLLPLQKDRR